MQLDDAAYMAEKNPQSKKFRRFHSDMTKCLDNLEKVPASDFASLNNGLMQVQKILENNKGCDEVPCKLQLCRVFGKCLDPNSDFMGVHRTGISTIGKIFRYLGPNRVARDFPLYGLSVFALLPHAAIQTRPEIFALLENYVLTLPAAPLLQCFGGLASAVLPCLNTSDGNDQYNRVLKMLDTVHGRFKQAEADASSGPAPSLKLPAGQPLTSPVGTERAFFQILWSIVHNNTKIRSHALRYLKTKLAVAEAVPEAPDEEEEANAGELDGAPSRQVSEIPTSSNNFLRGQSELLADFIGRKSSCDEIQLGGDAIRVHYGLIAALKDKDEMTLRLALDVLFSHFPLHEDGVFTQDQKVKLVAQVMLLLPSPQHAVLTRVFFWLYGGRSINWEYFENVSFNYVQEAFLWLFECVVDGTGDLRCFEALFQLLQRSDESEGAHFKRLLPTLIPSISKALCFCNRGGDIAGSPGVGLVDDSRSMHLFEAIPWSHFLKFGNELLTNLRQEIDGGSSILAESTTAVLVEVRSIIDSTSRHYMSLNAASEALPDLYLVLEQTNKVLVALCVQRKSGVIEVPAFVKCMRLGIHLFNTLYLGVMRGYLGKTHYTGPQSAGEASPPQNPTASNSTVTTQHIYRLASQLVCAFVDTHIVVTPDDAATSENMFGLVDAHGSNSPGATSITRDDAALFAEVCQTLYTVLSHGSRDNVDGDADGEGDENFVEDAEEAAAAEVERQTSIAENEEGNRQSGTMLEGEVEEEDEATAQRSASGSGNSSPTPAKQQSTTAATAGGSSSRKKQPKSGPEAVPQWLQRIRRVVDECPPSLALAAAQLFFDATIGMRSGPGQFSKPLLPKPCTAELHRVQAFRTVIDRLWLLLTASEAHQHMNIVQLLVRIYEHPECASVVDGVMRIADTSNCRRFATLFRVMNETSAASRFFSNAQPMTVGLMMMLSTLTSADTNLRLMSHAFLQHSVPYLNKVVEPMLQVLTDKKTASAVMNQQPNAAGSQQGGGENGLLGARRPSMRASSQPAVPGAPAADTLPGSGPSETVSEKARLLLVCSTFCNIQKNIPEAFVKRLLSLPAMNKQSDLQDFFHREGVPQDDEIASASSLFGSVVFLALRTVRLELHNLPFMDSFSSSDYDVMLQKPNVPSFRQGDDTPLCVTALELMIDLVSTAVGFDEPPETVTKICSRISVACVTLLREAVCARLPATQVRLLQLLTVTMKHLDDVSYFHGGGRRARTGSDHEEGDVLASTRRRRTLDATAVIPPLRHEDFFAVFSDGLLAGAVAELHPTMSCYGLLNQWTSSVTQLLPTFHARLSVATSCYISVFVRILQNVKHRALAPPVGQVCKKSFAALTELFEFMYLPSTRDEEGGGGTQASGGNAFSKMFGGGSAPDPNAVISNYDAAQRELMGGLHRLVEVAIDVFLRYRTEAAMIANSSSGSNTATAAAGSFSSPTAGGGDASPQGNSSLSASPQQKQEQLLKQQMSGTPIPAMTIDTEECHQTLRETLEAQIRSYLEPLLKNAMNEFFERIIVYISKHSSPMVVLEAPENLTNFAQIVDMLSFSAVLSPSAVVASVETQLVLYRKVVAAQSSGKGGAQHHLNTSSQAELPHDASCCLFLQMYMLRYRYKERNMTYLGNLLDALTNYVANAHSPLCAPLIIRTWDIMIRRFEGAQQYCDRRFMNVMCRLLENMSPSNFAVCENHHPAVLAMRATAPCIRNVSTLVLSRDPSDKLQIAAGSLLSGAVKPAIQSVRQRGITDACLSSMQVLYNLLLSSAMIVKHLRKEIVDFLFDSNFFRCSREALNEWRNILCVATKNDRETNRALMDRFKTSTGSRLVGAIVSSDDDDAKASLLKRLAFYITSMDSIDREMLAAARERLIEIMRNYHNSPRQLALKQVFFVFRVIMSKVMCDFDPKNQQHLANFRLMQGFWPIVMPELLRSCSNASNIMNLNGSTTGPPTKSTTKSQQGTLSQGHISVIHEVLKLVDFSITMLPAEFQTFRWSLLDDPNSKEFSRTSCGFLPLLRSLHELTPEYLPVNTIRSEFKIPEPEGKQRPLFALPADRKNRLQGIDVVAAALSAASGALEESLLFDPHAEEFEISGIIRKSDQFDVPYVQWLISGEFSEIQVNPDLPPAGASRNASLGAGPGSFKGGDLSGNSNTTGMGYTGDGAGAADFLDAFGSPLSGGAGGNAASPQTTRDANSGQRLSAGSPPNQSLLGGSGSDGSPAGGGSSSKAKDPMADLFN